MKTKIKFHKPPANYSYEFTDFKKDIVQIWIWNHQPLDYRNNTPVRSIWGFYSRKKQQFYSPKNSKTVGSAVEFVDTTAYSAMIPKLDKTHV
jgi:hypothetical protein